MKKENKFLKFCEKHKLTPILVNSFDRQYLVSLKPSKYKDFLEEKIVKFCNKNAIKFSMKESCGIRHYEFSQFIDVYTYVDSPMPDLDKYRKQIEFDKVLRQIEFDKIFEKERSLIELRYAKQKEKLIPKSWWKEISRLWQESGGARLWRKFFYFHK